MEDEMTTFKMEAFANLDAEVRWHPYAAGDRLAPVAEFRLDAVDTAEALRWAWEIGTRQDGDYFMIGWPDVARSMTVGDVVALNGRRWAVAPSEGGWTALDEEAA